MHTLLEDGAEFIIEFGVGLTIHLIKSIKDFFHQIFLDISYQSILLQDFPADVEI